MPKEVNGITQINNTAMIDVPAGFTYTPLSGTGFTKILDDFGIADTAFRGAGNDPFRAAVDTEVHGGKGRGGIAASLKRRRDAHGGPHNHSRVSTDVAFSGQLNRHSNRR